MTCYELERYQAVTLEEMLDAREKRAFTQQELLVDGGTLISYTLNLAGPHKSFPLAKKTFALGREMIGRCLERLGEAGQPVREWGGVTGDTAFWRVNLSAMEVKKAMCAIEEGHGLGRLFDMDVLSAQGKISREDLGLESRKCLICGAPGMECARSRRHSAEELQQYTLTLMERYFNGVYADEIAREATRALLYEVSVTPKPGLVDRANNGAHKDMDFFTFLDSATVLTPYFRRMALQGMEGIDASPKALFEKLRFTGQLAEDGMAEATGGVNTHKGAIFSIGLCCAAAGYLTAKGEATDTARVLSCCAALASEAQPLSGGPRTHGEAVRAAYGLTGVRGEAAAGFPSVKTAVAGLKKALSGGMSPNEAGVEALLQLLSEVDDTNLVHRSDRRTQLQIKDVAGKLLHCKETTAELLTAFGEWDTLFIKENLSPGGCADLLALAFLLVFLEKEEEMPQDRNATVSLLCPIFSRSRDPAGI